MFQNNKSKYRKCENYKKKKIQRNHLLCQHPNIKSIDVVSSFFPMNLCLLAF